MKKKFGCRRIAAVVGALLVLVIVCAGSTRTPPPLSAEEVEILREKYPVYSGHPGNVAMRFLPFDEAEEMSDTLIICKILDGPLYYSSRWPERAPSFQKPTRYSATHYIYRAVVIEDTKHLFKKGDIVKLYQSAAFNGCSPIPKAGDRFAVCVKRAEEYGDPFCCTYWPGGMFYITEGDYVISCFSEAKQTVRSGRYIKDLLREFA